jgi:four helix bundle protein
MKENIIANKTYNIAIQIVKLNKKLISKNEFILSWQLLKSGTSIGANVEEAIGELSKSQNVYCLQGSQRNTLLVAAFKRYGLHFHRRVSRIR